jgi:hypothetical protein
MGFFEIIGKLIKGIISIPQRLILVGKALGSSVSGIWTGISGSFVSVWLGIKSLAIATWETTVLIYKYVSCGFMFIVNLPYCFVAHIISVVFYLAYFIFFRVPIIIFEFSTGIKVNHHVEELFELLHDGDDVLYSMVGFRLLRFPREIENRCYRCHGKIMTFDDIYDDLNKFTRIGDDVSNTFTRDIPSVMSIPKNHMIDARERFKAVVQ